MYRVPHGPRQRAVRRLKIGIACLIVMPAIGFSIHAVMIWNEMISDHEQTTHEAIRYGINSLLLLSIPIIGILSSLTIVYATAKGWRFWKIALLVGIVVATLLFHGWNVYSQSIE